MRWQMLSQSWHAWQDMVDTLSSISSWENVCYPCGYVSHTWEWPTVPAANICQPTCSFKFPAQSLLNTQFSKEEGVSCTDVTPNCSFLRNLSEQRVNKSAEQLGEIGDPASPGLRWCLSWQSLSFKTCINKLPSKLSNFVIIKAGSLSWQ